MNWEEGVRQERSVGSRLLTAGVQYAGGATGGHTGTRAEDVVAKIGAHAAHAE